jgi:hypothetical protein
MQAANTVIFFKWQKNTPFRTAFRINKDVQIFLAVFTYLLMYHSVLLSFQ